MHVNRAHRVSTFQKMIQEHRVSTIQVSSRWKGAAWFSHVSRATALCAENV